MAEVIPAILVKTYDEFEQMVRRLEPHVSRVHLDISDGKFTPNATIRGYDELLRIETPLAFDVHLMVQNPHDIIGEWYQTKADRFLVHVENKGYEALVTEIRGRGRQTCPVLNPESTPDEARMCLDGCECIQFMTVHPGFYGGQFLDDVVLKIAAFHKDRPHVRIMVDGGITPETAGKVVAAGASVLVSGSYIAKSADPAKAIAELKNS